ncbi:S-adenosyl-L-methionine-dependent methyltransferase [Halteromyces radiatus]|uniref:S-adenosyl-L-methionine-dependent methyltransferase n=1 Tax=Halteromyces radiatus TaxID=101107 RepID=UPI00221FBAC0|nr:S-adenosyl-L-methionine-dependent methyltransferase [Halteromyces radiatus]KAI8099111.1 S-adenosyl-L-methionine-dependent methyltransferase [Halteromyces radiatus]
MGARLSIHSTKQKRSSQRSSTGKHHPLENLSRTNSEHTVSSSSCIHHGRSYHDTSSSYWLPNDDEENDRLTAQHFAIKALFNGNISPSVKKLVPFESGAYILDVGCASGTWMLDMATEYPASHFMGIDICDTFPNSIRPPNVDFKLANLTAGLPFPDNTFDLVNVRLFILALKQDEWWYILKEIQRVLKPDGCLQSVECGMLEGGTDFMRWAGSTFEKVIIARGQEPWISKKMPSMINELPGYQLIDTERKMVPLGEDSDSVCKDFNYDAVMIFKAAQPFLMESLGLTSETYPAFLDQLMIELKKKPWTLWSFTYCIAQKRKETIM